MLLTRFSGPDLHAGACRGPARTPEGLVMTRAMPVCSGPTGTASVVHPRSVRLTASPTTLEPAW